MIGTAKEPAWWPASLLLVYVGRALRRSLFVCRFACARRAVAGLFKAFSVDICRIANNRKPDMNILQTFFRAAVFS